MDSGAALLLLLDEADSKLWATPNDAAFPPFVEASAVALSSLLDLAFSRISAEIARLTEDNKHLERSQAFLLKLQKPLDRLTMAFAEVHGEAQEMQSILNSPEESLFRAHKLIADVFSDQGDIVISKDLSAKPNHSIGDLTGNDLCMIHALVLCSIFGKRSALENATNLVSLETHASKVLQDAQNSPGYSGTDFKLLKGILGLEAYNDLSDCLCANDETKQKSLALLKLLFFTPFKDFSNTNWPKAPFIVATRGTEIVAGDLIVPAGDKDWNARIPMRHEFTPFPQHAILDFILASKSEYVNRALSRHCFTKVVVTVHKVNRIFREELPPVTE